MDALRLKRKLKPLGEALDERARRLAFAAKAKALGRGGIARVHRATGMARSTIANGIRELDAGTRHKGRIRRPGGGRLHPRQCGAAVAVLGALQAEARTSGPATSPD